MSLARIQESFMVSILDAESDLPNGWGERHAAGMHIYRGNYRSALVEGLRDAYTKTEEWTGEAAFKQAAINHIISNPSDSWTMDDVGIGFDTTCDAFFQQSPEVAELAWLERAMLVAFSSADIVGMDLEQFGRLTSDFGEEQWIEMKIDLVPSLATREVEYDLHAIWQAQANEGSDAYRLEEAAGVIAWREDERGTFRMAAPDEVAAIGAMKAGQSYDEICVMLAGEEPSPEQLQSAAMRAGEMLGRWVQDGLVCALHA